jgi:hypothetical protein
MRHSGYNVRYSVLPINSSPLTITLYSSVITTLVYNDKVFSPFHDVITELHCSSEVLPQTTVACIVQKRQGVLAWCISALRVVDASVSQETCLHRQGKTWEAEWYWETSLVPDYTA